MYSADTAVKVVQPENAAQTRNLEGINGFVCMCSCPFKFVYILHIYYYYYTKMTQPSVACYFNTRKRSANEDTKIDRARKVLVLDSCDYSQNQSKDGLGIVNVISEKDKNIKNVIFPDETIKKIKNNEEKTALHNKIVTNVTPIVKSKPKKIATRTKNKISSANKDIQQFFNNMREKNLILEASQRTVTDTANQINEIERHITPPNTPKKILNALDKVSDKPDGPSIKEIRRKMCRSSRLAELKASMSRFQEGANKLKEVEKKTELIPQSPKLKSFKTIELEVHTSPQKVFSPEKSYLSPKKDSSVRRSLIQFLSPTKNAVASFPVSPSKQILLETSKPSLTLPYKYRYLAEIFRSIDVVCQILYNRKETITFRKLKPAVEEMLKRNLSETHLSQIRKVYPEAYDYTQEKLKVFGTGMKHERWELVIVPKIGSIDHMNSDILLQRRRKLFNILLDKVKTYHQEFLTTLDPPIFVEKNKLTRWHPEFDIEKLPDIEGTELPQPPAEEKFTTGQDVLEKARQMFNCNTRMEQALQKLKQAREGRVNPPEQEEPKAMPTSVLKGIPKALLERVRQKQAAKALVSMTRSADKEKEVLIYSRLPELARLTRNLFVSEKKGVLPLDVVVEKLGNCYRVHLTKTEMEEHLKVISKEVPAWLIFHEIRNCVYMKLAKNADVSVVINKLENLAKQKSEL